MISATAKSRPADASGWRPFVLSCLLAICAYLAIATFTSNKDAVQNTTNKSTDNDAKIQVLDSKQQLLKEETDRRFGEIRDSLSEMKTAQRDTNAKLDALIRKP